jgi:hypothetical protein
MPFLSNTLCDTSAHSLKSSSQGVLSRFLDQNRISHGSAQTELIEEFYRGDFIMGIRSWLSSLLAPNNTDQAGQVKDNFGDGHLPDEVAGLDFNTAIDAHMQWKIRLKDAIDGGKKSVLVATEVARDDLCVLGRWIHGDGGKQHGHLPQFSALKEQHAEFHAHAASVVAEAKAGNTEEARRLLAGAYARSSEAVKHYLIRLYLKLRQ